MTTVLCYSPYSWFSSIRSYCLAMPIDDFSKVRILIVDDSASQRLKLQKYLSSKEFVVSAVENGEAMKRAFENEHYQVVLMDVNMPGDDGFTLVPYLKQHHRVGIIMLTSSSDLVDKVLGLELGADDYITKPFEPRELIARIKSVLRRIQESSATPISSDSSERVPMGEFHLDLAAQQLINKQGEIIELTSMEFDLLKTFADNPDRVLSRDFLLTQAHKSHSDPFDRSIDIRVGRVRRKIEPNSAKPSVIKTVRGAGYIFVSTQKA